MWEKAETQPVPTVSHDMPCADCGHATHRFLPCDKCDCDPDTPPGAE